MGASGESVRFGTSGLRGRAEDFTPALTYAYVQAFLDVCGSGAAGQYIAIGADLRESSPRLVQMVAQAAQAVGWQPVSCGAIPTPALALYAQERAIPAIMVTGSHIPADRNGFKFYSPQGEILKSEEAAIDRAARAAPGDVSTLSAPIEESSGSAALAAYRARYLNGFAPDVLAGLKVGIFEHSAVGRELIADVLSALGAVCIGFGRTEQFVPIDTEAVGADHISTIRQAIETHHLHAVVSTDADGDRPLLIDETGRQINGDVLGVLTARYLGADCVVTPVTSTTGIEKSGWFGSIIRTAIGSPFVIAAMQTLRPKAVIGFEANGGVLTSGEFSLSDGALAPLLTRDALLPLISVLADAKARGLVLSRLARQLPARVMSADRIEGVPAERGKKFVAELAVSQELRSELDQRLGSPSFIDTLDGTRLTFGAGDIVHFRQSGNAPELRCYVETESADATAQWLATLITALTRWRDNA